MRVHASSTMLIVVLLIVVTITVVTPKNSIEVNWCEQNRKQRCPDLPCNNTQHDNILHNDIRKKTKTMALNQGQSSAHCHST